MTSARTNNSCPDIELGLSEEKFTNADVALFFPEEVKSNPPVVKIGSLKQTQVCASLSGSIGSEVLVLTNNATPLNAAVVDLIPGTIVAMFLDSIVSLFRRKNPPGYAAHGINGVCSLIIPPVLSSMATWGTAAISQSLECSPTQTKVIAASGAVVFPALTLGAHSLFKKCFSKNTNQQSDEMKYQSLRG